jgi:hypothetical protein
MKRISLLAFICSMSFALFAANKQPVALTAMPQVLQDTIAAHFTPDQILMVTYEKTMPKHYVYEFRLADGTKLKYTNKAQLLKISNDKGIDLVFVPNGIKKYVEETFPNAFITEYKRSTMRQEVNLNIDAELIFDKSGRFLRITD